MPIASAKDGGHSHPHSALQTGLPSNFKDETGKDFSIPNGIAYLQSLTPEGKTMAATYSGAPDFVKTSLWTALQIEPWFPTPEAPEAAVPLDVDAKPG